MSIMRDERIKKLLQSLIEYRKDENKNLENIQNEFSATLYSPTIMMHCMEYECKIPKKLTHSFDNFDIDIKINENYKCKNTDECYTKQSGIHIILSLSLNDIEYGITPPTKKWLNDMQYGGDEICTYMNIIQNDGFFFKDDNDTELGAIECDSSTLHIQVTNELYSEPTVIWNLVSSTGWTVFTLHWTYDQYLEFYSYIIQMIADNLDNKLLAKYDIQGE